MKRICVFVVFIFLIVSFTSSLLFAVTHSISVSTKHGQKIYLYKDSYALVIGVSRLYIKSTRVCGNFGIGPKLPRNEVSIE